MLHDTDVKRIGVAGDCRKLQSPESPVLKPLPLTAMLAPDCPELGVRTTVGMLTVTVNAAAAEISPLLPLTWTRYVPGVAVVATENPLPASVPVAVIVHDTVAKRTGLAGDCK
jgi:hypothetical protein